MTEEKKQDEMIEIIEIVFGDISTNKIIGCVTMCTGILVSYASRILDVLGEDKTGKHYGIFLVVVGMVIFILPLFKKEGD